VDDRIRAEIPEGKNRMMKMTKMMTVCLGATLLLGEALTAQVGPPPTESMASISLEEAIRVALRRSPALAQSDQAIGNALESRRTAWGAFLPSLSMSSGASLRSTQRFDTNTDRIVSGSSDSYNAGLSASMDVFQGGARFDELAQQVDFCVAAGAHGLVFPVLGSEFQFLTDAERRRGMEIVVRTADGRLPVVGGVAAPSLQVAVECARAAADAPMHAHHVGDDRRKMGHRGFDVGVAYGVT